jgi:hypothetical protein
MYLFLKKVVFLSTLTILIICMVSAILIKNNPHVYQQLYYYQLEKLKTNKSYSTLFIGDSSLGNAIDSDEFSNLSSQTSINCALTGLFGYAGSYNMLKTAHSYNSNLKNVIIMQTLNMQTRKVAMDGYVRSSTSIADFTETDDKINFVKNYIQYIRSIPLFFWIKKDNLLVNDYIKQNGLYEPDSTQASLSVDAINTDKNKYLIKIRDYCLQHNINMIYIHGPLYQEKIAVSRNYIIEINKLLNNNDIAIIEQTIPIKESQLGDTADHVGPKYKKVFTKMYYELLKNHLIY